MKEIPLKIKLFGDPVLRRKAKEIKQITQERTDILESMAGLMRLSSGVGLAAPQVGISESMIVADIGTGLYKLINPKIIKKEGRQVLEEGCLSIPGVCIKVKRAKKILLKAQDENAKPVMMQAEGLLACVFQHEIDHLYGRMIVDYASFVEKIKLKKRLAELKRRSKDEELRESEAKSCKLQL
jgi:peptide deformylase